MEYTTITEEEKKANLATNILAREHEINGYQVNINNYGAMLANLPTEWPNDLLKYKDMSTQQIATNVPDEHLDLVNDLLFADKIKLLLRTEKIEQGKAKHVYNALVSQLHPDEIPALLEAAKNGG